MGAVTSLRVALAEDEPLARARLQRLLEEAGCQVMGVFEEGPSLIGWLRDQPGLDALFLDIQMPGPSGLEVAAELPYPLPVIFVTAFREHALAAFELAALDYLLKPVKADRLARTLDRLRQGLIPARSGSDLGAALAPPQRVVLQAGEGLVFLDLRKVTHFEVIEETVYTWSGGRRFPTQWRALSEVEEAFAAAGLVRIQRHLLVRPEAIQGLRPLHGSRAMAHMGGALELEVSRAATARLKCLLGIRGEFGKRD